MVDERVKLLEKAVTLLANAICTQDGEIANLKFCSKMMLDNQMDHHRAIRLIAKKARVSLTKVGV